MKKVLYCNVVHYPEFNKEFLDNLVEKYPNDYQKRIIRDNYYKGARIFCIETNEENVIVKFGLTYNYPFEYNTEYTNFTTEHFSKYTGTLFCERECEQDRLTEIFSVLKINIKISIKDEKGNERNGDNQDQLQREEASDSGCEERGIIYGRRNIIKYSTGRHCDEAGIKNERKSSRRYKIIISSRCSEIYRS